MAQTPIHTEGWKTISCAPFVQTPVEVAKKMIQLADLKPGQKHFDIGAGDGRLVIMAAQETGSNSIGVEIEKELVQRARSEIERLKLEDRARMIHDDFFNMGLSEADVVTLYLSPLGNELIRPKLERELKKGARVISHDFEISNWKPSESLRTYVMFRSRAISPSDPIIDPSTMRLHTVYLYKIGEQF